jgi:hypothetical protein
MHLDDKNVVSNLIKVVSFMIFIALSLIVVSMILA